MNSRRFSGLVLLLAGCGASAAPRSTTPCAQAAPATAQPEIASFNDSEISPAGPGCKRERTALSLDATTASGQSVQNAVREHTRSWAAMITWGQGADARPAVPLTLEFGSVTKVEDVKPSREGAKLVTEAPCEAYLELFGTLHLRTDGQWDVRWPASVQVQASGDSVISLQLAPAELASLPVSVAGSEAQSAQFFGELTTHGAAGSLWVTRVEADGKVSTKTTLASWQ